MGSVTINWDILNNVYGMIHTCILDVSLGRVIDHQIKVTIIKHKRSHQVEVHDIKTTYSKEIF